MLPLLLGNYSLPCPVLLLEKMPGTVGGNMLSTEPHTATHAHVGQVIFHVGGRRQPLEEYLGEESNQLWLQEVLPTHEAVVHPEREELVEAALGSGPK